MKGFRLSLSLVGCLLALLVCAANASAATPTVKVGSGFSCAITESGSVVCWGANTYGQLGNGTVGGWSTTPVPVTGLGDVVDLATGGNQACAVIVGGTVKCWGDNNNATLGTTPGSPWSSGTPLTIGGITGATRVAVGGIGSACAIVTGGAVQCWGYNLGAALGVGSGANYVTTPTAVVGLVGGATDISHDGRHGCAVVAGAAKCWGFNDSKSIVNSATLPYNSAQSISGLSSGVEKISSGFGSTCVIKTGGEVRCWGYGGVGQNGNGMNNDQVAPGVQVFASGATSLSHGGSHQCALVSGVPRCWGGDFYGQIGDPAANYSYNTPVIPQGLEGGASEVDAGGNNSCAIQGQVLKCWGAIEKGAAGNGESMSTAVPLTVPGIASGASAVATGDGHTCAVVTSALKCWGSNYGQQLGDGTSVTHFHPVNATALNSIGTASRVSVSGAVTCARLFVAGVFTIRCVGRDSYAQLGDDNLETSLDGTVTTPGPWASGVASVYGSSKTTCAIRSSILYCWGENYNSRLGNGNTYATEPFNGIPGSPTGMTTNMRSVAIGDTHACAVQLTTLFCWGMNGSGQATGTSTAVVSTPTSGVLAGIALGEKTVAVAESATCAIVAGVTATVRCFGAGASGRLGNGSNSNSLTPVIVSGASGAGAAAPTALASASDTFCAIVASNVKCWGSSSNGELGNGGFTSSNTAITVPGTAGATDIDGWDDHFCATVGGIVKCWGGGSQGQLGNVTHVGAMTPVVATSVALFNPPPQPILPVAKSKPKPTIKLNGKIKNSGKTKIKVPIKLTFKVPAGATGAEACAIKPTISVKTSKKKTVKVKAKLKLKSGSCTYAGSIKLPKSLKGKKVKFSIAVPEGAATAKTTASKTLKLK